MSRVESILGAGRSQASAFFGWWGGELAALLPDGVKQRLSGDGKRIVLAVVRDGFQVRGDGARQEGGSLVQDVVAPRAAAIAAAVELATRERAGITVLLPQTQCFSRTVEVPRAAIKDCRRVLDLDLERATPFRRADVYTSYKLLNENSAEGKASVQQFVTKREAVDALIADVVKAGGRVTAIDVAMGPAQTAAGVNFIAEADGAQSASGLISPLGGLSLAAALLLLLACGQVYFKRDSALEELRGETMQLRKQAATVRQSLEQSEVALKDLAALQTIKLRQVPVTVVIEEITRILPDTAWVTDLRIENDIVDISGLAASGANLIPLFERSPIFGEAALTAPVTFDQREDKERFSLRVRIKSAEARQTGASG
jgi:general secretion pathway protein L